MVRGTVKILSSYLCLRTGSIKVCTDFLVAFRLHLTYGNSSRILKVCVKFKECFTHCQLPSEFLWSNEILNAGLIQSSSLNCPHHHQQRVLFLGKCLSFLTGCTTGKHVSQILSSTYFCCICKKVIMIINKQASYGADQRFIFEWHNTKTIVTYDFLIQDTYFTFKGLFMCCINTYSENIVFIHLYLDFYLLTQLVKFRTTIKLQIIVPFIRIVSSLAVAIGNIEATEPCLLLVV